jgi:hypothetical protein
MTVLTFENFHQRFRAISAQKQQHAEERHDAAAVAVAATQMGHASAKEFFSHFASYSDLMSRKEHRSLCVSLDIAQEVESRLWRILDPKGAGTTDIQTFAKCYSVCHPQSRCAEGLDLPER